MNLLRLIAAVAAALSSCAPAPVAALTVDPLQEVRICGAPSRTESGRIARRADVLAAFRRAHPCPATGKHSGACPGWAMDHTIPLACGGCDAVVNLSWLPTAIKSGADPWDKDRWERRVYCEPHQLAPMPGAGQ